MKKAEEKKDDKKKGNKPTFEKGVNPFPKKGEKKDEKKKCK